MTINGKILPTCVAGLGVLVLLTGYSPPAPGAAPSDYYEQGLAYERAGRYDRAERQFKRAIGADRLMAAAHLALGAVYLKAGRVDEAEAATSKAIATLPRSGLRGGNYAVALSMAYNNVGVVAERKAAIEVLKLDLEAAEAHRQEAESLYRNAMEINPSNSMARVNLRRLPSQIWRGDVEGLPDPS